MYDDISNILNKKILKINELYKNINFKYIIILYISNIIIYNF
jgi:hypothetical protein